ncbi:MAG: helix-hairpin-helix domain-containing protein [Mariniblastus sp.]|nr:helix-hairpin-helix domain-containing protein [Mariniblastus sp.]
MIKQLEFDYVSADLPNTPDFCRVNMATGFDSVRQRQTSNNGDRKGAAPSNDDLAEAIKEVAAFLQVQGANRSRVEAYYRAVNVVQCLDQPVWQIYELNGIAALEELPAIGNSIVRALQQMIRGGKWPLLERLRGNDALESAFASVPNIGSAFARRIHDELQIETLAELQTAAWDGRLERLSGVGQKRLQAIREALAGRGRFPDPLTCLEDDRDVTPQIRVAEILDIDDQYRFEVRNKTLPKVTPQRNNPAHEAWLPILHTQRGGRHYSALYSNTAHAHEFGMNKDWVVIYLEDHHHANQHGRWTVITSQFGKLRGKRIVRGRESACAEYYRQRV